MQAVFSPICMCLGCASGQICSQPCDPTKPGQNFSPEVLHFILPDRQCLVQQLLREQEVAWGPPRCSHPALLQPSLEPPASSQPDQTLHCLPWVGTIMPVHSQAAISSLAGGRKRGCKVPGAPSSMHRKRRRWGRSEAEGSVPWIPLSVAATSRSSGEGSSKYQFISFTRHKPAVEEQLKNPLQRKQPQRRL